MHPILIQFGPVTLYTYGLLVALAFTVGTLWAYARAKQAGENPDNYLQAIIWIILCGFTGARLLYVIYYPELYLNDPLKIIFDRGGLVWYGGLISAVIASLVFAKMKKLSIPKFGDILLAPAALGLAIGRLGCFAAGCCYGKATTAFLGVQFPPGHETHPAHVHPTQLYESIALIVLVALLQRVYKRSPMPGTTMALFFIGYGIIRFIIEYFRGDTVYWVDHLLTASQVLSLIGVAGGLITLFVLKRSATKQAEALTTTY